MKLIVIPMQQVSPENIGRCVVITCRHPSWIFPLWKSLRMQECRSALSHRSSCYNARGNLRWIGRYALRKKKYIYYLSFDRLKLKLKTKNAKYINDYLQIALLRSILWMFFYNGWQKLSKCLDRHFLRLTHLQQLPLRTLDAMLNI